MYGLSIGISKVNETLPRPVYALLSGLNSATVGIIALAAVQLAQKAITDKITRILVFLGATAGLLYNALWYFPLLMFLAGLMTVIWDFRWLHSVAEELKMIVGHGHPRHSPDHGLSDIEQPRKVMPRNDEPPVGVVADAKNHSPSNISTATIGGETISAARNNQEMKLPDPAIKASVPAMEVTSSQSNLNISWPLGAIIIVGFLITFMVIIVLRGVLKSRPLLLSLFANLYLAGTIIFGGGPVVIPLLRE